MTNEVLYRLSYISDSCDLPIIAYNADFVNRVWRIFFGDFAQRNGDVPLVFCIGDTTVSIVQMQTVTMKRRGVYRISASVAFAAKPLSPH